MSTTYFVFRLTILSVVRSASMDDLVSAMAVHNDRDGPMWMMFENDETVPFTFASDEGAEISLGKMRVIDVYDERYLVGHSVWHGAFLHDPHFA